MKRRILCFWACILILCISQKANACIDCIETEINGSACTDCPPDGWSILEGIPDVCDASTCSVSCSTDSFDGGGIAVLHSDGISRYDAIGRTITGLSPGVSYLIGFEVVQCSGGALLVEIDGNRSYFEGGSDFENYILCVVAESTDMEIILQARAPLATDAIFMVDYLPCSHLVGGGIREVFDCEAFTLDIGNGSVLCPGEDFLISNVINPSSGTINVLWECDPPEGLDYLSDLNALEPTFNFPDLGDSNEQIFNYTVYVDKGGCQEIRELEIIVSPSITPQFNELYLCEDGDMNDLPWIATNGYTGTWDGPMPLSQYAGEDIIVTFYLEPGQNNCSGPVDMEVYVDEFIDVVFFLDLEYCTSDSSVIVFPDLSDNAILGEWTLEEFIPRDIPPGIIYNSFIPNFIENPCAEPYEVEIKIIDAEVIGFDLPNIYCRGEEFTFPNFDTSGIRGRWETNMILANTPAGLYENRFEPIHTDCDDYYIHQYRIADLSVTETLIDPSQCEFEDGSILINGSNDLEFSIDSGMSWQDQGLFDNLSAGDYQVNYRFKGAEYCQDSISFSMDSNKRPEVTDIIITDDNSCASDNGQISIVESSALEIEFSIDNGSSWQSDVVFRDLTPGNYDLEVRYVSDPTCMRTYAFEIQGVELPVLQSINSSNISDCDAGDGQIEISALGDNLQYSIDNGLSFSTQSIYQNLDTGTYNIIIAGDGINCSIEQQVIIYGPTIPTVAIQSNSPSSCIIADGSIDLSSNRLSELEFSIDNGLTWQSNSSFDNLEAGNFTILYRLSSSPNCSDLISTSLNSPDVPTVDNILAVDNTSCLDPNGVITIQTSLAVAEYSIDGGVTWQSKGDFTNLEGGLYLIQVRLQNNPDCIYSEPINLEEFELPEISNIVTENVTDCNFQDGTITILSTGVDLLYQLDGLTAYQSDNVFQDLAPGEYVINISESGSQDCIISETVTIESPSAPDLFIIEINNATACDTPNGSINLSSSFDPISQVEYSLDGLIWTTNPLYTNLSEGNYTARIRLISANECNAELDFRIETEAQELVGLTIDFNNPSTCELEDGNIIVNSSNQSIDLEYSLDNIDWKSDNTFQGLAQGVYTVYIRGILSNNCTYEETLSLNAPDCPCEDYILIAESTPVKCELELGTISITLGTDESIFWSDGSMDNDRTELSSGWYGFVITYQDENCQYEDSIFIDRIEGIDFILESFPSDCEDLNNGYAEITDITGGDGSYSYSLDAEDYQEQSGFYNLSPGQYELYATDELGCMDRQDFLIELESQSIDLTLPQNIVINEGDSLILNPLVDISSINSFYWSPRDHLVQEDNIILVVQPDRNISYTLTIEYGNGCTEIRTIDIIVIPSRQRIYIPNMISIDDPNNSSFFIGSSEYFDVEIQTMSIYDRWGNEVFNKELPQINNPYDGWNPHSDSKVEQGVYVYILEYTLDSKFQRDVGTVTVIR